jgi:Tol biopolymer transport system component
MKGPGRHRSSAACALTSLTGLGVIAVLTLAACGGSGTTASSSPSVKSSPSVTPSETRIPLPTPTVAGTIAFTTLAAYNDSDICVVNTDGTGLKTLAGVGDSAQSQHPRWSPDGKKIVYSRSEIAYVESEPGPQESTQVWVMNADGSGKTQLTKDSLGPRNFLPSWSPDGKQIVFTSVVFYTDGVERDAIYVMNADGSGLRNVTSKKGPGVTSADYWPTWEKDGTITFYRNTRGGGLSMFSVNPDGSGLRRLVKEAGTATVRQWLKYEYGLSPDGKWVARHDVKADRLVVVPVRGSGPPVTLLDPVAAYAHETVDVTWSPDGKALAIAGQSETYMERLYVVNADGTGLSAVPGVDAAKEPAWRPE